MNALSDRVVELMKTYRTTTLWVILGFWLLVWFAYAHPG